MLIIGGGPAGSTLGSLLRKYSPDRRVVLVEASSFPRYHIGESLLLEVNRVLADAGTLDAVANAGFLEKAGATYVWGQSREPWSLLFAESAGRRPHFDGMQDFTWHVDRGLFDQLLLRHAAESGVEVVQPGRVTRILMDGERVRGAELTAPDGSKRQIRARYTVDASGRAGVIAKRFGQREFDPILRNVATFGYWTGAHLEHRYSLDWDRATITVVTIPDGWLWFIPMQDGIVSVGVVTSTQSFKVGTRAGVERYYEAAVRSAPEPARWLRDATLVQYPRAPARVMVESDFNYAHSRAWGPGWALVGDAAAFVDPLFTFGVFLATTGAQLLAYSLGTLMEGYPGATEERVLGAYEQHLRGYYEAFRAMLLFFYGFNSTKERFWAETRDLVRGHALPPSIGDRDAFLAFTFGFGVNTMLFHEATQTFGHASLNHIRNKILGSERDDPEAGGPGAYEVPSVPWSARPVLAPFRRGDSAVPVAGTGRVIPMTRVEFGAIAASPGAARFPRYLYVPDELVFVLEMMDGHHSASELARRVAPLQIRGLRGRKPEQFLAHILRSLAAMGVVQSA